MRTVFYFLILLFLSTAVWAENRAIPVQFASGATGTELVEGIARGETATFVLGAAAGQKMRVSLTSVESNAEFEVFAPNGLSLGASTDKQGAQVWYGTLPQSGSYKVVVGTARGGAEITINFSIR
jgi:hypothetical protein